jgi:hypothetical protein
MRNLILMALDKANRLTDQQLAEEIEKLETGKLKLQLKERARSSVPTSSDHLGGLSTGAGGAKESDTDSRLIIFSSASGSAIRSHHAYLDNPSTPGPSVDLD